MSPKRPRPQTQASVSTLDSEHDNSRLKVRRIDRDFIKVNVLDAKLDSATISEISNLIETQSLPLGRDPSGASLPLLLCGNPEDADVIITAIKMRARLERHVPWHLAKQKAIVTPQWLRDSVKSGFALPYSKYTAVRELAQGSEEASQSIARSSSFRSDEREFRAFGGISHENKYACRRNSPLICPNQSLIVQLGVLRLQRELEGLKANALSYERAISIIKAYPEKITEENVSKVSKLPGVGGKIITKIREFLDDGVISESVSIEGDENFQCMKLFTSIYGIGPAKAKDLYARGLRTLDDLKRYFDVPQTDFPETLRVHALDKSTKDIPTISMQMGILLKEHLDQKIPRSEVEAIYEVVAKELNHIMEGCVSEITGGYRRGKLESNDVDIIISHKDLSNGSDQVKGLCKKLVTRLYEKGMVTHVMHLSSFRTPSAGSKRLGWDSLEKALTVFKLPEEQGGKGLHRRLDIVIAAPEVYWTAVVGWTGSTMFERDIRLWAAKEKGLKFDSSGISREHDSKLIFPMSEREVFEVLELDWIEPTMRNADV